MEKISQHSFKLRRQVNASLRKRDHAETAHSPCPSTYSAGATHNHYGPSAQIMPFNLQNQHSVLSAGRSAAGSSKSRKRRREFLDLDTDGGENELVRFVLDTQGRLESGDENLRGRSARGLDSDSNEQFK